MSNTTNSCWANINVALRDKSIQFSTRTYIKKDSPLRKPIEIQNHNSIRGDLLHGGLKAQTVRKRKALEIALNMEPYDILKDLDAIQLAIIMKPLLAVAPKCLSTLTSSLICQRQRNQKIHEVNLNSNLGAPTIDVTIDTILISRVQVDGGSSVD